MAEHPPAITLSPEDMKTFNALNEQILKLTFLADHHVQLATTYQHGIIDAVARRQALLDSYKLHIPAQKNKPVLSIILGGK